FTQPVGLTEPYPAVASEDNSRRSQALTAWVTVPSSDSFRLLSMKVLTEVLLSNSGSPLRKALIDSKLGTAMADGTGLQDDYKESVFGADLASLQQERSDGRWFENGISTELLDNSHRALLTIVPGPDLEDGKHKKELERLALIEATLSEPDRNKIAEDALRLKAAQDARQDLSVLPTLELTDIPMRFDPLAPRSTPIGGAAADSSLLPSNGVPHSDIRSDSSVLPQEQLDLLPLFGRAFTQS